MIRTQGLLLVANKGDETLSIIDIELGKQIAAVPEGGTTGHEVAASLDGSTAYVPIYGTGGVSNPGIHGDRMIVIDIATQQITGTVHFGKGVRPHLPVVGPKNGMVYVTIELENAVAIVDPKTLQVAGQIPTGQRESHMLAISSDGRRGYTANVGPGTVSVLDLDSLGTTAVIPISGRTQRISISKDDRWVFTSDQTQPRLAVIDTATNQVAHWVTLPGAGFGTASTPDGMFLLVDIPSNNQVAVVDLATFQVVRTIAVPATPQVVVVRPDGKEAYVSCDASGKVAIIDLASWTFQRTIDAGNDADGLAWVP